MAALGTTTPSLLDYNQALGPNDSIDTVIEMLNQTNPWLYEIPFMEANELTGHVSTVRTGIPEPTFRKFYQFVQPSKTTRVKVRDATAMMENYGKVDKAEADLNNNAAAFRLSEDKGIIEGFGQKAARYMIYGNSAAEPESFMGIMPRFNSLSAENAENIIVGGSATASLNSSILLVGMSKDTVCGIYPKGSRSGVQVTDKGQQTDRDGVGGAMEVYETHYRWDLGLCVRDWRYIVRIPNILSSTLTKDAASGPDLIDLMSQALDLVPKDGGQIWRFLMNRKIKGFVRRQMVSAVKQSTLEFTTLAGPRGDRKVLAFDGIPIEQMDVMLNTEELVA